MSPCHQAVGLQECYRVTEAENLQQCHMSPSPGAAGMTSRLSICKNVTVSPSQGDAAMSPRLSICKNVTVSPSQGDAAMSPCHHAKSTLGSKRGKGKEKGWSSLWGGLESELG